MSAPDPTHRTLNLCFGGFHSVRMHLGLFCYSSKLGAKRAQLVQLMQSTCHEVISELFAINAPNPMHWIQISCFGAFHSVWVHLGSFHNCLKLSAKWSELVVTPQTTQI